MRDHPRMHPRKRLDVAWGDLFHAATRCAADESRARAVLESAAGGREWLAALSVRSALDLALSCASWPAGTRVVVSALTIPDMLRVLRAHGLEPVAIDVDPRTLEPDRAAARRIFEASTRADRPRAVLLAHLYGTRIDLEPWIALARAHGAELWEDAAQAWTGDGWRGDARSDLVFLSFGPIKTGTALAGGLVRVADAGRRAAMGRLQDSWPRQRARAHLARVAKYAFFKLVATRACFGAFDRACRLLGTTSDDVVAGSVRGFSRERLLEELRRRPGPALLASMARRWSQGERARVARQRELGESLRARLAPRAVLVGGDAHIRHHWVAAVASDDPARLVAVLRGAGYDATARATLACNGGAHEAPRAHWLATRLVYLPLHAEMGRDEVERLADELQAAGECGPRPLPGPARDEAAPRLRVVRAGEPPSDAPVAGDADAAPVAVALEAARRS